MYDCLVENNNFHKRLCLVKKNNSHKSFLCVVQKVPCSLQIMFDWFKRTMLTKEFHVNYIHKWLVKKKNYIHVIFRMYGSSNTMLKSEDI